MCIFAHPARVSKTRILVAPLPGADRLQLTVYENQASSDMQNAMILPVPWGAQGVHMLDVSGYPNLWKDCEKYFPEPVSKGFSFGGNSRSAPLPVQRVGGYEVTIVPSVDDIRRIDPTVFALPGATEALLRRHYSKDFGFVVCRFTGTVAAHPIAYVSHMVSDKDRGLLFIPTRHEHEGANPAGAYLPHLAHTGIWCDGCKRRDFVGTRWKCANCADYDLCDACHANRVHTNSHVFLELPRPLQQPLRPSMSGTHPLLLAPVYAPVFGAMSDFEDALADAAATNDSAAYDHTLYIVDAAFVTSEVRGDYQGPIIRGPAETKHIHWLALSKSLPEVFYPATQSVLKIVVTGQRPNLDCWAQRVF